MPCATRRPAERLHQLPLVEICVAACEYIRSDRNGVHVDVIIYFENMKPGQRGNVLVIVLCMSLQAARVACCLSDACGPVLSLP